MGKMIMALKKLGKKMTGKSIESDNTVGVINELADKYEKPDLTPFATKTYVDQKYSAAIKRQIVQSLPETDIDTNTIYMVLDPNASQEGNVYNEYLYSNNAWELIGTTAVSGSGVEYINFISTYDAKTGETTGRLTNQDIAKMFTRTLQGDVSLNTNIMFTLDTNTSLISNGGDEYDWHFITPPIYDLLSCTTYRDITLHLETAVFEVEDKTLQNAPIVLDSSTGNLYSHAYDFGEGVSFSYNGHVLSFAGRSTELNTSYVIYSSTMVDNRTYLQLKANANTGDYSINTIEVGGLSDDNTFVVELREVEEIPSGNLEPVGVTLAGIQLAFDSGKMVYLHYNMYSNVIHYASHAGNTYLFNLIVDAYTRNGIAFDFENQTFKLVTAE